MSTIEVKYREGHLAELTVVNAKQVEVHDCRSGCDPFITVAAADDEVLIRAFLPPDVAKNLYVGLGELFDPEKKETPE